MKLSFRCKGKDVIANEKIKSNVKFYITLREKC